MKKLRILLLFTLHSSLFTFCSAQIITTIAGNGYDAGTPNGGYSGDGGQATSAELYGPSAIVFDNSGNMYIAEWGNNIIRKITASSGIISTVAGTGCMSYYGDKGPATAACLSMPSGVALDSSGNIYIADSYNNVIRKVTASTGIITTIAGDGFTSNIYHGSYSGDGGPATTAGLNYPSWVTLDDSDNIYIADQRNNAIRKVTASTGIITTVAGNPSLGPMGQGYSGDGGPATAAQLNIPTCVTLDASGNIYIADCNNSVVRKVTLSTGIITTVAGVYSFYGGYSGDGGQATAAEINADGVSFDGLGNMYISDGDYTMRKVTASTGIITTVAGIGNFWGYSGDGGPATAAELDGPGAVTFDNLGNMFIPDDGNNVIRKVTYAIAANATVTANASCNGVNNGSASATGNYGTAPYTYSWSPTGGSNSTVTELSAATYTVTVEDNYSFTSSATITITQPPAFRIVTDSIPDNGNCTGSAWVTANGGFLPYTYAWAGGDTTDYISYKCHGGYCCMVSDANGCSENVCVTIVLSKPTGIENISNSSTVNIYPNPNTGIFIITLNHSELVSESKIEVYSVLGEKVYNTTLNQPFGGQGDVQINLSSQPNGVYFYRVLNEAGGLVGEGKLVIEK